MALSDRPVVLVLRALGLGDLLTGVPALRALRTAFAEAQLVLATPASMAPLVAWAGVADDMLAANGIDRPLSWTGPHYGRRSGPDVAVNLHGRGPQSHRLLLETHPGGLIAFTHRDVEVDGPVWRAEEHEVDRWCRLVEVACGVTADPEDLLIDVPPRPLQHAGAVVIHPGAAFASRRWPPERYAEVASWAAAAGHDVVVTGSTTERQLADDVCASADLPPDSNLAGRTSLVALAALVAHARLLVCGDTGVAHLATAFRTSSVVLFGPVSPALWGPRTRGPHTVLWKGDGRGGDGRGDPWGDRIDPSLASISVDEVLASAEAGVIAT